MSGDDNEKSHAPTQKRLDDARQKGEAPRSHELAAAASSLAFVLAAWAFGSTALRDLGEALMRPLAEADRLGPVWTATPAPAFGGLAMAVGAAVLPFLLLPAVAALAAYGIQGALFVTPGNLAPRLSRVSPLATLSHRFGARGLFDFARNTGKMALACAILAAFAVAEGERILSTLHLGPAGATAETLAMSWRYLGLMALVAAVLGMADHLFQRANHLQRMRMSRQELLDEQKSSEGDPHLKAARRQRAQEVATNRMLVDVARADVVIVNPTHYAVALRWDRGAGRPPVCVAKGVDEIAARIRERAAAAGVPLFRDPPTARALHGALDLGQTIRPEHYAAVAAAIRFADALRKRAFPRRRG